MAGYIGSKASVVSSGAERKKTFTITGATTSLTGLNYTVGKVHVFQNGVRLVDGTDYTATNGTTITLTVAAQSGDNVVVISQASFQLSEHYTSAEADAEFVTKTGDTMSGNLDVTGTVTADGLTVDGSSTFDDIKLTPVALPSSGNPSIALRNTDNNIYIQTGSGNALSLLDSSQDTMYTVSSTSHSFNISNSERMRIDSSGAVTMPAQPAFLVRPVGTQVNIPNLTTTTVLFGAEVFDQNSDFSSNTFTAPVTGKYQLSYGLRLEQVNSASSYYHFHLRTSNRVYANIIDPRCFDQNPDYWDIGLSALADMDAGDTAYITAFQAFGSAQMDIHGDSFFSGYLVA